MNSFSILRTNVGLTTNVKVMIDSNYNLSLNSIDSNYVLSSDKYKKFEFNKNRYYDEIIPSFYKGLPSDIAFQIKYNNDSDDMGSDFKDQYDEIYNYGARNIIDNKNYDEEYEYFAPLYIQNKLPSNFFLFRVDGSGIETISKENFKSNVLKNFKVVKSFDLGLTTDLGQWLNKNFIDNKYFPDTPLEIYFQSLEFSKWNGIDYDRGGYTSNSIFLDSLLEKEREIFELEKFIFNNYKNTKTIFPNILNFSFLFDDTPSTPDIKRRWSLNRYYGFYVDEMELSSTLSPYKTPKLRSDVIINDNNLIISQSNINNPFEEEWTEDKPFYIEYKGEYYLVKRFSENRGESIDQVVDIDYVNEEYQNVIFFNYKIISDINLSGLESEVNKNYGYIDSNNILRTTDESYFEIDDFDNADVWIIEIDGIYHNLVKNNSGYIKLNSDYTFNFSKNFYEYKVSSEISKVSFLVDYDNSPIRFSIYKLKFTDIKDFDTRIVDTEFSKYEYEKKTDITDTDEPKIYFDKYNKEDDLVSTDEFRYKGEMVNIPVSSEYTANYETFKIENNELSDIWRINPVYCRWGVQNSLSNNDYPYLLNNSILFEDFNKSPNPFSSSVSRRDRNLDYFYTINSSTSSYVHHTLHVESFDENQDIDVNFKFDFDRYLNSSTYDYDYFTSFFERPTYFESSSIKKNVRKYSNFNKGDSSIPNSTVFKGLEFKMYEVNSLTLNQNGEVDNINASTSNEFNDYKFSVLLTESPNNMNWEIIEEWELDKEYESGDVVVVDDILYVSQINDNSDRIYKNNWGYLNDIDSILWSPTKSYSDLFSVGTPSLVYNSNEYYYCLDSTSLIDFWRKDIAYPVDYIVLYKNQYYLSLTSSNTRMPDYDQKRNQKLRNKISDNKYWEPINEPRQRKWDLVKIWNPSNQYSIKSIISHEDKVYIANGPVEIGEEPGISIFWEFMYSLNPDTDFVYKQTITGATPSPSQNPMLKMNNRYYIIRSNDDDETLDNGIHVYINKRWKNILINIYVNDNTMPNLSNKDRDDLYTDFYSKLLAINFVNSVNDISNSYEFINLLRYTVIDETGNIFMYDNDNNIEQLPYFISCETPNGLVMMDQSLIKSPIDYKFKSDIRLSKRKIDKISNINWYNDSPIAYSISENKVFNANTQFLQIYRFSGYYMPVFYDIQIFSKNSDENIKPGNYLFDTELSEFGMMKERKMNKINRNGSVLKLSNSQTNNSVFPMIDEFGYIFKDFMIFKSTWDFEYNIETVVNKPVFIRQPIRKIEISPSIGQPDLVKLENQKKYTL